MLALVRPQSQVALPSRSLCQLLHAEKHLWLSFAWISTMQMLRYQSAYVRCQSLQPDQSFVSPLCTIPNLHVSCKLNPKNLVWGSLQFFSFSFTPTLPKPKILVDLITDDQASTSIDLHTIRPWICGRSPTSTEHEKSVTITALCSLDLLEIGDLLWYHLLREKGERN